MTEQSTDIAELAKALAAAQAEVKAAKKDSINPFFKGPDKPKGSTYADLASVWDACREPLTKHGFSVIQMPVSEAGTKRIGVETMLLHASGQWKKGTVYATPEKETAQAIGSCITYLRRYSLAAVASVAPEDDDGNEASGNGKQPAGGAAKANTVKAAPAAKLADASQVQQIHILKEKIGGWTGKADHDKHPYRAALLAYKDASGKPVTTSKDLTFEQAANLIKRMQGMVDRQTETLMKVEATSPIAGAMDREPGDDDDGEAPDPGLLQDVRDAAKTQWGKKVGDLAPQWLQMQFGVQRTEELTRWQARKALEKLLSGDVM